jgi:hypothetical protein
VGPRELQLVQPFALGSTVDWNQAACQGLDTEKFFGTSYGSVARAKGVCRYCFVQAECLSVADELERGLGRKMVHGIWGGLTPDERIKRRRASSGETLDAPETPVA